jgi:putative ABC transport system permease protein
VTEEDKIASGIDHTERGLFIRTAPATVERICDLMGNELNKLARQGRKPIVLVSPQIRAGLKQMTAGNLPRLTVLSFNEVTRDTRVEIVGIVADIKQYGVDKETTAQSYEPFAQSPFEMLNVVVRTKGSPAAMLSALRPAVYSVDKDQPIGSIRPLEDIMAEKISQQRFAMLLLTVFSVVALVIAAVGIYGVMAYSVVQRTGEIGIRMALGAQTRDVLRLVLSQAGKLIGVGLLLGLLTSFWASRAMGSMLFRTSAHDPLTLASITVLLAAVALVACLLPARRATKVNPIEALRVE